MTIDLLIREQIEVWRRKAADGTITDEELRLAIAVMRQGRVSAGATSVRARASKAPIDADALLNDLENS